MDDDDYERPYQDGDHCRLIGQGMVKHYCLKYDDGVVTDVTTGEILS